VRDIEDPEHYTRGSVECIDAIASALGAEFGGYCRGNAIKYLFRAGSKIGPAESAGSAELRDLLKARWFINRRITALESAKVEAEK